MSKITKLLDEVSRHLLMLKQKTEIENNMKRNRIVYNTILEKAAKLTNPPNYLSILYQCVAEFLIIMHNCSQYQNEIEEDWSCSSNYNGQVHQFSCHQLNFEISILREVVKNGTEYVFVIMSVPNDENKSAYLVKRFKKEDIPTLKIADKLKDESKVRNIAMVISDIFRKYCSTVGQGKYIRESCPTGVNPVSMSDKRGKTKAAKRARKNVSAADPVPAPKYKDTSKTTYETLVEKYKAINSPMTDSAKLFGVIYEFLLDLDGVESGLPADSWPVSPSYCNEVLSFLLPRESDDETEIKVESEKLKLWFFIAILKNENEYYLSLRSFDDPSNWIVKKIVKMLVPSFNPADENSDKMIIRNLEWFVTDIRKHFIDPVLKGTFRKQSIGFLSGSSSEGSSSPLSTDVESATPSTDVEGATSSTSAQSPLNSPPRESPAQSQ